MDCHSALKGDDEEAHIEAKNSLMGAIWTIIVADAMMSIDNVIGVVGAKRSFRACYRWYANYGTYHRILFYTIRSYY